MAAFESSELVFDTFGVAGSCGASSLECGAAVDVDAATATAAAAAPADADVGGGGAGGKGGCSASDAHRFVLEIAAAAPRYLRWLLGSGIMT